MVRYDVFGTDLFKKETNMKQFIGLLLETKNGDIGSIQSSFGTSGQFRVNFPGGTEIGEGDSLFLRFKRYTNDPKKAIHQDGSLPPVRAGSIVDPPPKKKKNKGRSGSINGSLQSKPDTTASKVDNARTTKPYGEIVKIKGEVLPNGKYTVAIVSGLFSMEDDINPYIGRSVHCISTDEEGAINGSFGKMGKCKILFKDGISADIGSRVKILSVNNSN